VHPQHGPLYYALQWLAFVLRDDEWGGRAFAALFGLCSVPLLWMSARAARSRWPWAGAALLAISPLHVYYSREARPYALLVLLIIVALLAILERIPWLAAGALVLMLYTSVAAASAVASIVFAAFAAAWLERDVPARRRLAIIALLAVLVLALFPLLYRSTTAEQAVSPFPGWTPSLCDSIVRGLSVTALDSPRAGRTAYAVLALAALGAVALARRNRSAAAAILAMAILPVVFSVVALSTQNHFFGIRYVIAALPAYLLLAGFGIAAIFPFRRALAVVPALAIVVVITVIGVQTWPAARSEAFRKLDWRGIAETIQRYARTGDLVVTAEPWSGIVLHHYLARLPHKVLDLQLSTVPLVQVAIQEHPGAWLVSGGFSTDAAVRNWMCAFPVVLASPLEGFRMHYTSRTGGHFFRERAGPVQWRAVAAALGERSLTLQMTAQEDFLLGEGWAGPEGSGGDSFRWAVGRHAELTLPRFGRADRTLRLRVTPIDHPTLPRQTMRISLNGRELRTLALPPGTQELAVPAPAAVWRDGLNTLAFDFGRATAPAEFDPSNTDPRKLAVAFDWIAVGDPGAPPLTVLALRLPPLPEVKPPAETRFPPGQLDRDAVTRLLGRIGHDPAAAWPQLARGQVRLEDLIETVESGTDCMDDPTFIRYAFTLLLGRAPGEAEVQSLIRVPRDRIVGRLGKFEELRKNIFSRLPSRPGKPAAAPEERKAAPKERV
ncbi:MAG TPA: glycosyltransferase family 39 protein, partial [Thermoanaerobaculia bacterium]|nr:glycosyltransferase family 39 protein [Thermoanaerobaculia bacterium]